MNVLMKNGFRLFLLLGVEYKGKQSNAILLTHGESTLKIFVG